MSYCVYHFEVDTSGVRPTCPLWQHWHTTIRGRDDAPDLLFLQRTQIVWLRACYGDASVRLESNNANLRHLRLCFV